MNYIAIPGLKDKSSSYPIIARAWSAGVIIDAVVKQYRTTYDKINVKDRSTAVRLPRQIIMYLLSKNTNLSLKNIGDLFSRDHTTVIHAVKHIQDLIDVEPQFKNRIREIERNI